MYLIGPGGEEGSRTVCTWYISEPEVEEGSRTVCTWYISGPEVEEGSRTVCTWYISGPEGEEGPVKGEEDILDILSITGTIEGYKDSSTTLTEIYWQSMHNTSSNCRE